VPEGRREEGVKSHREGEWFVTTPVYIGLAADLEKAKGCSHQYVQGAKKVEQGHLMIHESCALCVASRARYREATAEEMKA
jgi:hypothetical protein